MPPFYHIWWLKLILYPLIIFMVGANNWRDLDKSNVLLFNRNKDISLFTLKTLIFLDKFRTWKLLKWIIHSSQKDSKERRNFWFPFPKGFENGNFDRADFRRKYRRTLREKHYFPIFDLIAQHDLAEMVRIALANKIKVIICSYPVDGSRYIKKNVAKRFGVLFVDNSGFFSGLPKRDIYFSSDGWHPNDEGYKLLAKNIYNCILEHKLITEPLDE